MKPSYFVQTFTPPEKKDEKYWEKRGKNNIAARRFGTTLSLCCSVPVKYKIKQICIDTPDEDGSYAGSICSLTGHDISQATSRFPCCGLLALSWNTAGGGDSIYWVVKCLSPYFTQEWAFLTNFFAEYTCHRNKWELEAKNWFIEVKNIPKKRSLLKSFLKGPASNQEFLKCATTIQEIPKWASSNQEFLKCATTNWEFPKCASSNQVTHFRNSWIELAHFGNSQFVVAQFRNSWIELAHFGNFHGAKIEPPGTSGWSVKQHQISEQITILTTASGLWFWGALLPLYIAH